MQALHASDYRSPRALLLLAAFLVVAIGVGSVIGVSSAPGEWYAALEKPPFNPPNWIFAPVWFTLYAMMAVAGWRTFLADPNRTRMRVWYGQMLLNWAWSPVFFALQMLWPAVVVIVALWLCIVGFIVLSWRHGDRVSAGLFVPYLAWVSFATLLNVSLAILN